MHQRMEKGWVDQDDGDSENVEMSKRHTDFCRLSVNRRSFFKEIFGVYEGNSFAIDIVIVIVRYNWCVRHSYRVRHNYSLSGGGSGSGLSDDREERNGRRDGKHFILRNLIGLIRLVES